MGVERTRQREGGYQPSEHYFHPSSLLICLPKVVEKPFFRNHESLDLKLLEYSFPRGIIVHVQED